MTTAMIKAGLGLGAAMMVLGCRDNPARIDGGSTDATDTGGEEGTAAGSSESGGGTTGSTGVLDDGDSTGDPTSDATSADGSEGSSTGEPSVCPPVPYTVAHGETYGGLAGWRVASVGDFDGDGIGDYAIASPRADTGLTTDQGRVHVIRGGQGYDDFELADVGDAVQGWVIEGEDSNHRAGDVLSPAGDIDGDGKADLILSSNTGGLGVPVEEQGRWSIVTGRDFESTSPAILLADVRTGEGGFAVDGRSASAFPSFPGAGRGVGDVNLDGLDDILIGAPFTMGLAGPSFVDILYGRQDNPGLLLIGDGGPVAGEGFEFMSNFAFAGFITGGGGDVNGDGTADFMFGANTPDGPLIYVVFGGDSVQDATLDDLDLGVGGFTIDLAVEDALFEAPGMIAMVGDINGDGRDEIGLSITYPLPEDDNRAGIGIVYGKDDTDPVLMTDVFTGTDGFVSTRPAGNLSPTLGFNVGGAGDINGDGLADMFIADGADPLGALGGDDLRGRLYVAYGREGMDSLDLGTLEGSDEGFIFDSPEVNDDFAQSVDGGRDVNGDAIPDLVIGAPQDGPFGSIYVLYGFNDDCPRVR